MANTVRINFDLNNDGLLDNDIAGQASGVDGVDTAGNNRYYGTDGTGTPGFFDLTTVSGETYFIENFDGAAPTATGTDGLAIGEAAAANNLNAIAIGSTAVVNADNAIQLGTGTNAVASSLQFLTNQIANAEGLYTGHTAVNYSPADADNVTSHISAIDGAIGTLQTQLVGGVTYKGGYDANVDFPSLDGGTVTLTGTADINATVNVVGTGTAFLTEVASGDSITINGETRVVDVVTDNTNLTVTAAFTTTASGQTITKDGVIITTAVGDMYTVTSDATFFTQLVTIGDVVIAEVDSASVEADWTVIETNLEDAADVAYNNGTSGLTATDVQAAIDEIDANVDALGGGGETYFADNYNGAAPTATGTDALAIGEAASSSSQGGIAIGEAATVQASSNFSIAIGGGGPTTGASDAIAIGYNSDALNANAIAFGSSSLADADNAIAIGRAADAGGIRAIALGFGAAAGADDAIQLGQGTNNSTSTLDFLTNRLANAEGLYTSFTAPTNYTPADTDNITSHLTAIDTALGATGETYFVDNYDGAAPTATGTDALAIGEGASAAGTNAISIGINVTAAGSGNVVIGANADGSTGLSAVAVGNGAQATGTQSVALGDADATGGQSIAIGVFSEATEASAIAIGNNADSLADSAIAIGPGTTVNLVGATSSVAIGDAANCSNANAIAIGFSAEGDADDSIAIGTNADTTGADSIALGNLAVTTAAGAIQLAGGTNSTANTIQFANQRIVGSDGILARTFSLTGEPSWTPAQEGNLAVNTNGPNERFYYYANGAWQELRPVQNNEQTLAGTKTLTTNDPRYQILDPNGTARDVILPDPPTANDLFVIINDSDGLSASGNTLNIKETAAGGVIQTLDDTSGVTVINALYTGTKWVLYA